MTQVNLAQEQLAKELYQRKLVLIRPDQHVSWRSDLLDSAAKAEQVLGTVTGRINSQHRSGNAGDMRTALLANDVQVWTRVAILSLRKWRLVSNSLLFLYTGAQVMCDIQ